MARHTNDLGNIGTSIIPLQSANIAPGTDTVITIDATNLDMPDFMLKKWGLDSGAN